MFVFKFVKALWNWYIVQTWYDIFPPKSESEPGDDADEANGR